MAEIGRAFRMEVIAWSQHLTPDRAEAAGARLAPSKETLLTEADIVSIHLVLSDRTRGLLSADELALMKPDALLINTSRAGIIDQPALLEGLRNQRIAGAGLDVFETEPLPADHPYRDLPNVLATPHLGYVTARNYRGYFAQAVENIQAFLDDRPLRAL